MRRSILLWAVVLVGCGDDDAGGPGDAEGARDGGGPSDAGALVDLGVPVDSGPLLDGGPPPDRPAGGACDGDRGADDAEGSVMHEGRLRTFQIHLPDGYDDTSAVPLVLSFHGRNSSSSQQQFLSAMNAKADDEGFIAVHPDGIGQTWNVGFCCGEAMSADVDDVSFVRAMLDWLEATYCVDSSRIYATGLSNGGFLAHRLACEVSDRVAAIAPVAGTKGTAPCTPGRAVPVLHFHGTADAVVPYEGFGGFASVDSTMSGWVSRNGCDSTSGVVYDTGDVTCEEWTGCDDGARVRLCTVDGGGHQWPGGFDIPGLGYNTDDISATDAMWDFFSAHTL